MRRTANHCGLRPVYRAAPVTKITLSDAVLRVLLLPVNTSSQGARVTLTYDQALDFLFPRTTTIKFGLGTTRALLATLGNPHDMVPCVHIGGTNGKGSVSTLIAEALSAAGWRVGLYTSPHLVSFRERIRVDGAPISEAAVAMWTQRLMPLIEDRQATFFEVTTAIAFADFAARGAEIAVVEVGLGGRLDSTNVVRPLASAVTRIEMDHMKYLGDTLEDIAREKAGHRQAGRSVPDRREPSGAGRHSPPRGGMRGSGARPGGGARHQGASGRRRVDRRAPAGRCAPAAERGGGGVRAATRFPTRIVRRPRRSRRASPKRGSLGGWIAAGSGCSTWRTTPTASARWCARSEELDPPRPLHALVSILGDKEWAEMLVLLDQVVDRGILTRAPTAAGRGWNLEWLGRWLRDPGRPPARASWSLVPDFEEALRDGAARSRDGARHRLVPHGRRRDADARNRGMRRAMNGSILRP